MVDVSDNEYGALIDDGALGSTDREPEYESLFEDQQQRQRARMIRNLQSAERYSPDQVAQDTETARRAGVPRGTVERNRDEARRVAERRSTDYEDLIRNHQEMTAWLAEDPENARVSRDDLEALKRLDGVLHPERRKRDDDARNPEAKAIAEKEGFDWLTSAVPAAFESGQKQVELARIGFRQLNGNASEEDLERAAELESQITGDNYGASGWWQESLMEATRQLPILGGAAMQGAERGAQTGLAFGAGALALGQAGPQAATPEEVVTVPGATATGMAVGGRAGAAEFTFELESGLAFREFRGIRNDNGERLDEGAARMGAYVAGALNAGAEVVGLEVLARSVPGAEKILTKAGRRGIKQALKNPNVSRALSKLAQRYAGVVGTEAATEAFQEATTLIAGEIAKNASEADFENVDIDEAVSRVAEGAKLGAQAASILGAPGPGSRFVGDTMRARQARQNQQTFEALGEAATESKTRERAPERFRNFVERVRQDGPVENIHVPVEQWDTYFQGQELNPGEVAAEVLGDSKQYAEAQATGGDLVIPVERYAEKLAGSEHHGGLVRDLRLRPGDMTLREAEQFEANQPRDEQARREADAQTDAEGEAGTTGENATRDSSARVFDDTLGQLLNAGVERSAAEQQAWLMQSAFRSFGERSGTDPFELYQRFAPRIRREIPELLSSRETVEAIDPLLDRIRAGEVPTQREAQGPSLVEFLREEGGIVDEGGELAARDPDQQLEPFQRRLIRPDGEVEQAMSLEGAAQRAAEQGYFADIAPAESEAGRVTSDMLLEAIDRELKGDPVFSEARRDARADATRRQLEELGDFLDQLGIDLSAIDNETARQMLEGQIPPEARPEPQEGTAETDETVLAQAAEQGYEGTDPGEARAWVEAVEKGLDMSQGARLQRAQELGFDTDTVLYHGTGADISQFDPAQAQDREGRARGLGLGAGKFYLAGRPEVASQWAENAPRRGMGDSPNVMPVFVRGEQWIDEAEYQSRFEDLSGGEPIFSDNLDQATRDQLIADLDEQLQSEGVAGIRQAYRDRDGNIAEIGQVAVYDESAIRSIHAAFDPDNVQSEELLAQGPAQQDEATDPVPEADELQALRERVAELEEELRTDDLTGLRNRKAFEEDAGLGWPTVGALDMDGLKKVNDNFGHQIGDQLINEVASVFHKMQGDREGVRFYRTGGDEFLARFRNQGEANSILAELQQRLEDVNLELEVTRDDGTTEQWIYEGIGLTYGVAPDEVTADARANEAKSERERLGLREPARDGGTPRRARRASDRPGSASDRRSGGEPEQVELFQSGGGPRLSAVHNLSADNLRFADEMGGLAVPSIAVQTEGQSAISGFGEISLIGGRTLADPAAEPVFEADAYSARFPPPEYPKVGTKQADALVAEIREFVEKFEGQPYARPVIDATFDNQHNTPQPDELIREWQRSNGVKAKFLADEKGIAVEPEYREPQLEQPWVRSEAFQQWLRSTAEIPADWEAREVGRKTGQVTGNVTVYYGVFDGEGNRVDTEPHESPDEAFDAIRRDRARPSPRANPEAYRAMSEAIDAAIQEHAEEQGAEIARGIAEAGGRQPTQDEILSYVEDIRDQWRRNLIDEDGLVFFGRESAIARSIEQAKQGQEVDRQATSRSIDDAIRPYQGEFLNWIRNRVMQQFEAPTLKVKGRRRQYTLSNIVDAMRSERVAGQEQTMVFGTNEARAASARQFANLEQMRAQAAESIVDPEGYAQAREKTDAMAEAWREAASEYFLDRNVMDPGRVDIFGAFDGAMRATARLLNYRQQTKANLRKALSAEGFDAQSMPDELLDQGIEFAEQLKQAPVPYFEAKPQRAVPLSEFRGAAIPESASAETRAILERHGLEIREYNDAIEDAQEINVERTEAIEDLRFELADDVLFQRRESGPRGRIRFTRGDGRGGRQFTIELLENADLSTFLHETGHFFLEVMGDLAEDPNAAQSIKEDYATVLNWMGVSSRDEIGSVQHEQWARGFEAYLFEGRAPTEELQGSFARFRAWLLSIYRQLKALNVELTDEVRGVMDRILATDDEITAAREEQNYAPMFESAQAAGMTEAEFAEYQRLIEQARTEAEEDLSRRALNQMRREERAWWKELRSRVRDEVEAEINRDSGYQAMHFLQRGELPDGRRLPEGVEPVKLSKEILLERYGKTFMKRLPRPFVYSREGGVDPGYVADLFGFSSGDELVRRLAELPARRKAIEAETDQRMRDRFGDMMQDGTLPERAMNAVHNERRTDLLLSELRALGRQSGRRPQPAQVLKQSAQRIIGQKPVAEIRPDQYRRAEAKAARKAFEAATRQDFETAYAEKQRQIFNHHLYREAKRAREDVDSIVAYMSRFERKTTRQRIAKAGGTYLEQIDNLMDTFEFRRNVSLRRIRQRQSFREWIADRNDEGFDYSVDPALARFMEEARKVNYRELTYEALVGVRDSVKFIEHLARTKNQLLAAQAQRDYEGAVDDIVSSIEANHTIKDEPLDLAPGLRQHIRDFMSRAAAEHTKPEFLFTYLDGEQATGPVWQRLFKPINDANREELELMGDTIARFHEIWSDHDRNERRQWYTDKMFIEELGVSMNKANILSMALNWGNEQNREALLEGYGWSRGQVEGVLQRHMKQKDWDAVQATWDLIDSLWPRIKALEEQINGIAPAKVDAAPVETPFGQYAGGYYPLKYDSRLSDKAFRRGEREASKDLFENNYARAATKRGHTIERVGSGGQKVRLDLSVATEHLHQAIHDVTHRRAIMDVDKLVGDSRVRQAIERTAGQQAYRQIRPWLQSIASEQWSPPNAIQDILSRARAGATIVNMGWKVTTAIVQPLGYFQSVDMIGGKWAWKGLGEFYSAPRDSWAFVRERSTMMVNRQKTFDRDIKDAGRKFERAGTMDDVKQSYFMAIGLMDMSVSLPTWLGAYRKAMEGAVDGVEAADENAAIDYADQAVRTSQSAGDVKDLAGIQRHTELFKIFTMFYSYFNALYNLLQRRVRQVREGRISRARFVASMLYLWFMPSVLSEIVAGRGPEEDEEWWKWALKNEILYGFGTIVGVRDVANAALTPFGFEGSPAFDAPAQTARAMRIPYKALTDEDITRSDVKSAVLATSYWAHLPGRQMWITGEYAYDLLTGEDEIEGVQDFLHDAAFGRPADER